MIDHTLLVILAGASVLGFTAGALGSFAVLRRQSLIGDAISHAALPGITIAFLLTLSKNPLVILLGALASGWLGTILIQEITARTKLKEDAALGVVLSVFFGAGIFLLTMIQRMPTANKSGLDNYLFGSAATMLQGDVVTMAAVAAVVFITLFAFWKEFKLLAFDKDYAQTLGFSTTILNFTLTTLIVAGIVIGLQAVGVVLMSAIIIAPAAAARQWTDRLGLMVLIAGSIGAASGAIGAFLSSSIAKLPTGPMIVLSASAIVAFSILFAPKRGIVSERIMHATHQKSIQAQKVLYQLGILAQGHKDPYYAHDVSSITAINKGNVAVALAKLENDGLVKSRYGKWGLTEQGLTESRKFSGEMK